MKALVYQGPKQVALQEVPDPAPQSGEVVVRIEAVGICGSDMHAWLGHDARRPAPLILGHEAAGVTQDGRRVTINPLVSCGTCPACKAGRDNLCPHRQIISMPPREGAFAEMVAMPAGNLVQVPAGVPLTKAALAEPLACGWHAVRLALQHIPKATTALVLGGGAIGLGGALALSAQGVPNITIVEPNEARRERLAAMGHLAVAEAPEAEVDIVLDGVGFAATRATASAKARPGGVIAHIGLGSAEGGLDIRRMTLQEITFIGTYTYTAQDFRDTAQAIFEERLGPLDWAEERPLSDGVQAFDDIHAARVAAPKVVLVP
ncbi:MAG: alcohol dehydrogenase catalytic domain-containing protein [Pseudomonadota bacterium]